MADDALEMRVKQGRDIELSVLEHLQDIAADIMGERETALARAAFEQLDDLTREQPFEHIMAFASDTDEFDALALSDKARRPVAGIFGDIAVKGAA